MPAGRLSGRQAPLDYVVGFKNGDTSCSTHEVDQVSLIREMKNTFRGIWWVFSYPGSTRERISPSFAVAFYGRRPHLEGIISFIINFSACIWKRLI